MVRYTNCCFCVDIRIGAFIIAMLNFLVSSIGMISNALIIYFYLPTLENYVDEAKMKSIDGQTFANNSVLDAIPDLRTAFYWKRLDLLKDLLPWAFLFLFIIFFIRFYMAISLVYGLRKKKTSFIMPWLMVETVGLITGTIALGLVLLCLCNLGPWTWGLAFLAFTLPFLILGHYFLSIVYCAYLDIVEEAAYNPENPLRKTTTILKTENLQHSMPYISKQYDHMVNIIGEIRNTSEQNPEGRYIRMLDNVEEVPEPPRP